MAREDRLFSDVVDPAVRIGTRRWFTLPLSILGHVAVVGLLVVAPLLATDVLPTPRDMLVFLSAVDPPAPPPPPPVGTHQVDPQPALAVSRDAAPPDAPDTIAEEPVFDTSLGGHAGPGDGAGHPFGVPGGMPDGVPHGDPHAPPPPPRVAPEPQGPHPVGGDIAPPEKIRDVRPGYPALARAAGISGAVIIEATIGPDGRVQNARVLRSVPLLDDAALDAVRQWEYTPTRLNGEPVAVLMTVTVVFSLAR